MKVSTKGRYGLRVMLELALHCRDGAASAPVMMSSLARSQGISRKYMHGLLTLLKHAGLVRALRGSGGGYLLARAPGEIAVSEVVEALEGPFLPVDCLRDPATCKRIEYCVTREVWQMMGLAAEQVLAGISLETLVQRQMEKGSERLMFHI